MDRRRIYLAGPISLGDLAHNIAQASAAFIRLMRLGFAPFCPQWSAYAGGPVPHHLPCGTAHEDWMGVDLPWVRVSEAVLRLPGESRGADAEVAEAKRLGIPVFTDEIALVNFFNS